MARDVTAIKANFMSTKYEGQRTKEDPSLFLSFVLRTSYLFGPGNVIAFCLEPDAVEALVHGDVEHGALVADAEVAVARQTHRLLALRDRLAPGGVCQL